MFPHAFHFTFEERGRRVKILLQGTTSADRTKKTRYLTARRDAAATFTGVGCTTIVHRAQETTKIIKIFENLFSAPHAHAASPDCNNHMADYLQWETRGNSVKQQRTMVELLSSRGNCEDPRINDAPFEHSTVCDSRLMRDSAPVFAVRAKTLNNIFLKNQINTRKLFGAAH